MSIRDRENTKLTKDDIESIRSIKGFPLASDEEIISLSRPPYYTACPNPFIKDFIREYGSEYDEKTDDYHREPFAYDVSEGKYDPLYKLHSYPTKVPHKAIMKYINHYTKPGDIVFDGFCGTGMTGLAAQSCGILDENQQVLFRDKVMNNLGARKAILCDLSPTATFIAHNYNDYIDTLSFFEKAKKILDNVEEKFKWMNRTDAFNNGIHDEHSKGEINYIVWSRLYSCPNCNEQFSLWDVTVDYDFEASIGNVNTVFNCPKCNLELNIKSVNSQMNSVFDVVLGKVIEKAAEVPVLVNYIYNGKRYEKIPDARDYEVIEKINRTKVNNFIPNKELPFMHETHQRRKWNAIGATHEHHMYTKKTLLMYSELFEQAKSLDDDYHNRFMFLLTSCFNRTTKLVRYMAQHKEKNVGPLSGTLYTASIYGEINVMRVLKSRLEKMKKAYYADNVDEFSSDNVLITTQSTTEIDLPKNSIDYIFVDPPFGDNLMYSELNRFTDMWLKVYENNGEEAIINKAQNKALSEYQLLMKKSFERMFFGLKPGRWITVEFHNSKNSVWNAIQETLQSVGFVIADVRTLDKKKGTSKQMSYATTVKQDLVISAYKPKEKLKREIIKWEGSIETAWFFVRNHLENLPVIVMKEKSIEIISERQAFLLFDRMIAYHIVNNISIPLDAADFYRGLDEKFIKRDDMYFLSSQINEYDHARISINVEPIQFELFVTNEKSAIAWLYRQLEKPKKYSVLQPKFMQETKTWDRFEKKPELMLLLEENFLVNDNDEWYIPDRTKESDLIKLREKHLLKEFTEYLSKKEKLKLFRTEAIRIGFAKLWKEKDYINIVKVGNRLPDIVIQEDDKLLMYYDISLSRVE